MAKKAKKTNKNNIETYFEWFANELIEAGYLEEYDREGEKFTLFPQYNHLRLKTFKTKDPIEEEFRLMSDAVYTYDYRLFWTEKARYIFHDVFEKGVPFAFGKPVFISHRVDFTDTVSKKTVTKTISLIDVKPTPEAVRFSGSLSSYHTFPFVQKILFNLWGWYVNKTVPIPTKNSGGSIALFPNCFTPRRYLFTDGGKQGRKINFKTTSLEEYVAYKTKQIERIKNEINGGGRQQKLL